MALNSINTNIAAYSAQGNIGKANNASASSIARLSSGNRITRAADDVAALSAGTSLRTSVTVLKIASLNASQGSSLLQVADGALAQITDILQRKAAIATQATSGSLAASERGFLNQEFQALADEIDRLALGTNFNGVALLDGTLGSSTLLASTDLIASTLAASGSITDASTVAISAFFDSGANQGGAAGVAGAVAGAQNEVAFMDRADTAGNVLADAGFLAVNPSVYGEIGEFTLSDFTANVSAKLHVEINGVEFTGTIEVNGTSFIVSNGNTHISFFANTAFTLADQGVVQTELLALNNDYAEVAIAHTSQVLGINVAGTALAGVTGNANSGISMLRTFDPSNAGIGNFRYVANSGAANTNQLAVDIGGVTYFTNNAVSDAISAGDVLSFADGTGQAFTVDLTGLTTGITDIRISMADRENFINALNQAFAAAAGGVAFAIGNSAADQLVVNIGDASTSSIFGGASLDVNTIQGASDAIDVLNLAIDRITSLRADVGALQSRFDFAAANIDSSIQNQDAARGVLLDTDIGEESTAYAVSQVQLQAGIAVLAQANLIPENLLKLIG